jgi:hypothetical protein
MFIKIGGRYLPCRHQAFTGRRQSLPMSADPEPGFPRRRGPAAGSTTGLAAATAGGPASSAGGPASAVVRARPGAGTPEQVRLAWGDDPAQSVAVSWASPGRAVRPRVRIGQRVIAAAEHAETGPAGGSVSWSYHARIDGLRPGATYGYAVTANNDAGAADPFSATFTTAPQGRAAFRFTSFGDLAAPGPGQAGSRAAYAVGAVESFQPLFHLINGDLGGAAAGPGLPDAAARAAARRDVVNSVQPSAAYRPWLPVPSGPSGAGAVSAAGPVDGPWYAFRVGTALFVCLSGEDVALGEPPRGARGYSGGAQTRWLEATLAAARGDASLDWIVVQLHPCACSSGPADACDLGVRREWLPLFDTYEVDLVLAGHGHGYERSFPVRGFDGGAGTDVVSGAAADTRRPRPVTTVDSGVFDTSQGTVHLVLGSGAAPAAGARGPSIPRPAHPAEAGPAPRTARVLTGPAAPDSRPAAAMEAATWSARRDASAGYGIAVFDVHPGGEAGGQTSVTVRYYHADGDGRPGPAPGQPGRDYALFETFTLVRPRSDGRRWHPRT